MVTLKDLSNACGLSVATVSRALNGHEAVRPDTAERIRKMAQAMGYQPNIAARALKTNRSHNIGILYENLMHHEYFSLVIGNLRLAAQQLGYDLTFLTSTLSEDCPGYVEHAMCRGLDGVIIVQADFEASEVKRLAASGLPCVTIDHTYDTCSCVLSANRDSMAQIVRRAYLLGHRRIAFIHGEDGEVTRERLEGFRAGCRECGIPCSQQSVVAANFHDFDASILATRTLLSLPEKPTCILYPDDVSCLGTLSELRKMGYAIPRDLSIVGYDGIGLTAVLEPQLTTYQQNAAEIGQTAIALLTEAIDHPDRREPRRVIVPGQFLPGQTLVAPVMKAG